MSTWARSSRGLPYYRQAIQIRRQLLTAHPEERAYRLIWRKALRAGEHPASCRRLAAARALFSRRGACWSADRDRDAQ